MRSFRKAAGKQDWRCARWQGVQQSTWGEAGTPFWTGRRVGATEDGNTLKWHQRQHDCSLPARGAWEAKRGTCEDFQISGPSDWTGAGGTDCKWKTPGQFEEGVSVWMGWVGIYMEFQAVTSLGNWSEPRQTGGHLRRTGLHVCHDSRAEWRRARHSSCTRGCLRRAFFRLREKGQKRWRTENTGD